MNQAFHEREKPRDSRGFSLSIKCAAYGVTKLRLREKYIGFPRLELK
jgi:hypothetical protein